jgi:phenylacetate-CoA ligase
MIPFITRNVIFPVHERLLGRRTFRYLAELERSQWASPDDLRARQQVKLDALLRHARSNTGFYRQRFLDAGIDLELTSPMSALQLLPPLDKAEIRASINEMIWQAAPGGVFRHSTGGSTGTPLIFYFDRRRQAYDQAARLRSHRWFGANVGDRELYLWGSPMDSTRGDAVKRLRDELFNHRLLSAFDMSARRMDQYLDAWDRFRPVCLYGYPSSIVLLIEHARSCGRRVDTRKLKAVFVTGEVCHAHQREIITSFFSVPVADGYGSREAGFIAHECPEGGMHLCAENVIVEIIDGDAQPVPTGETGEIVVTHLDAYAMPFIRYRTGDIGRLKPGRCPCGRGLPMMDVVEGRTTDFLVLPDGTVRHALSIIYPLREMPGVRQFRVTQHEDYSVTVEVVADDAVERITREAVAKRVRPVVGERVDLRVELVDRISGAVSGKHRYVVSHVRAEHRSFVQGGGRGV